MVAATQKGSFLRWIHRRNGAAWGMDPGEYRPDAVARTVARAGRLFGSGCYFGLEVEGWEHVPPSPAMVVSNHSGGTIIPDVWGFLVAWYRKFGVHRPIHPLAHDMILSTRLTGTYFEQRGIVRANAAVAARALSGFRRDVMVMPGGDLDTWRPYHRRYEVQFAERTGYVRTALRAGVPIVPVANAGAHETFVVLTDGRRIARALGLPGIARAEIFPVHLSLPWGLAVGPWPHWPMPARLRYRIGRPIPPPADLSPGEAPSEEVVRAHDARVRQAVQRLLDDLRRGERG